MNAKIESKRKEIPGDYFVFTKLKNVIGANYCEFLRIIVTFDVKFLRISFSIVYCQVSIQSVFLR